MPHNLTIEIDGPDQVQTEDELRFEATGMEGPNWRYTWHVRNPQGHEVGRFTKKSTVGKAVHWRAPEVGGLFHIEVTAEKKDAAAHQQTVRLPVQARPLTKGDVVPVAIGGGLGGPIAVNLRRSSIVETTDVPLWPVIRATTEALSFNNYAAWMDSVFANGGAVFKQELARYVRSSLPFPDAISYKALKLATEAFMLARTGVTVAAGAGPEWAKWLAVDRPTLDPDRFTGDDVDDRVDDRSDLGAAKLDALWRRYLVPADGQNGGGDGEMIETLPYLALVRGQLPELRLELNGRGEEEVRLWYDLMSRKFSSPTFVELIWSYWHEEGMLVQTINAVSMRFQNRSSGARDPLAAMAIDPLRPLNNLLWGYIQDEQHRLTLARRVAEYDQEYGLTLYGRAVPRLRTADPRSRFLEAFHTLLHRTSIFYKEDDDTTMIADPFPLLNALRDVHMLLAEGAHNQYGDLPWTARQEMLIQQWLLGRPELAQFLPTRVMVVEPERWMPRVDAMKKLQGWTDTPVRYFRDLAIFGEQLLLSIRFGNWGDVVDRDQAGNWARDWRQEVQWYIHAYQTATGVDLSADTADTRQAQLPPDRYTQPAFLLRDRLTQQRHRVGRGTLGPRRALPSRRTHDQEQAQEAQAEFQHPIG